MDKKEQRFQSILYDFISLLPYCVYRVDDEGNELLWGEAQYDYDRNYHWPSTRKALIECGIDFDNSLFWENIRKPLFLYLSWSNVMVGDGWISFNGDGISILYDHWDNSDYWDKNVENQIDGQNIRTLKNLFEQFLKTLRDWEGDLDNEYCIKRFGEVRKSFWRKELSCIDDFLQNYKKQYIFQTGISKSNFLRICKNESCLRLNANKNGKLTWDILSFMRDHVNFSDCFSSNHYDFELARRIFNIVHFEPYEFEKKTKEKVLGLSCLITKKNMNLRHTKADEDVAILNKSIARLVNNEGNLFEIKDYQSRFFLQLKQYFKDGTKVLSFVENTSHYSDSDYNKYGDAHRSFLVVTKGKRTEPTRIWLIPTNKKYTTYHFQVKKEFEQIAITLIVGYFKSYIDNKRQCLLIKPLFNDFGIVRFEKI